MRACVGDRKRSTHGTSAESATRAVHTEHDLPDSCPRSSLHIACPSRLDQVRSGVHEIRVAGVTDLPFAPEGITGALQAVSTE